MTDATGAAPEARTPHVMALMFGVSAAPIFWLGQIILAYGVSAFACYPADHPVTIAHGGALRGALILFDALAVVGALAGLLTALACLRGTTQESRNRFLAMWGIFSSLCFLAAILFNILASAMVPLCVR